MSISNTIFIVNMWIVNSNGLISEVKTLKQFDFSIIKIGDVVTDFYGHKNPLYNISDLDYTLSSDGLVSAENLGKKETLDNLLKDLVSEMQNLKIDDLHMSFKNEDSMFTNIKKVLNENDICVQNNELSFNIENYIKIRNRLKYENSFLNIKSRVPYSLLINIFDGFLYQENILNDFNGVVLAKLKDTYDDKGVYIVSYSDIKNTFRKFMDYTHELKSNRECVIK